MLKFTAVVLLFAGLATGQSSDQPFNTQAPANARYEIRLVSFRHTFRLDRFSGQVFRMTQMPEGVSWEEMPVADLQPVPLTEPRFQLVNWANSESVFLLDTFSGQTWRLSYDIGKNGLNELNIWLPIKSEKK
jgi:hypothetical protein